MTRLRTRYTQRLPTAPGLRLDVPFFEGSGEIAHDLSGKDNHGTLHNVTWTSSEQGPVGSFNGSTSYSDHGKKHWLNLTDAITIEARVKSDAGTGAGIYPIIAGKRFYSKIYQEQTNNGFYFEIQTTDGWQWARITDSPDIGNWHHLVATFDSLLGSNEIKVYCDGVFIRQSSLSGTILESSDVPAIIGGITHSFNGTIDEVRIYNRAVSIEAQKRRYEQPWYDYCRGS